MEKKTRSPDRKGRAKLGGSTRGKEPIITRIEKAGQKSSTIFPKISPKTLVFERLSYNT